MKTREIGRLLARVVLAGSVATVAVGADPARSQSVADFYKGKTVSVVIGYPAGGGFDVTARLLIRHMPRHLPGNPTMIAKNMPGAGSLRAANYLYGVAPKDGTEFGIIGPRSRSGRCGAATACRSRRRSSTGSAASIAGPASRSSGTRPRCRRSMRPHEPRWSWARPARAT